MRRERLKRIGLESYDDMELNTEEPDLVYIADQNNSVCDKLKLLYALEVIVTPDDPDR